MKAMRQSAMRGVLRAAAVGCLMALAAAAQTAKAPAVGAEFPEFTLASVEGPAVSLAGELRRGPVVVVVLRGWPGYQCPFCTRQFGEYLAHAEDFAKQNATLLFIYPGAAAGLKEHAAEFRREQALPAHFRLLVDPDLRWVEEHGLRWTGAGETSYPAAFVVDRRGEVRLSVVAKTHGARVGSAQLLSVLGELRPR